MKRSRKVGVGAAVTGRGEQGHSLMLGELGNETVIAGEGLLATEAGHRGTLLVPQNSDW